MSVTDQIDIRLAAWWPEIRTKQEQFRTANGRYWQGRRTHTLTPADGNELAPDRADEIADSFSWNQMATLPPTMLSAHEFNVIDGGDVLAFELVSEVMENGQLKRRTLGRNSLGEETDSTWQIVGA